MSAEGAPADGKQRGPDPSEYPRLFREITEGQSIDDQAMTFLRAFVADFQGKFQEV